MIVDQDPRFEVIDQERVSRIVDCEAAFDAVTKALVALDQRLCVAPEQMELQLPGGGELHVKGGYLYGSDSLSFKVGSGQFQSGGNDGFTIVLNARSGHPRYLIDDSGWLTEMRTGAAGALASDLLARSDAATVAVLGTGVQARFQVAALRQRRPGIEVILWGRDEERARRAAEELDASMAKSPAEAVGRSDIVITVTSARSPILFGEWILPGTHVTAIGADMAGKRELDSSVIEVADLIVCDDVTLSSRVGELQHHPNLVGDTVPLSGIVSGRLPGRHSEDDITIADLCGLGLEDAAIADLVVQQLSGSVDR